MDITASFNITPNGWITAHVFHTWLRDCFVPAVASKTKLVVLFVDGHASHTSALEIIDLCRENGIILYCLKSHALHLIQPLDQALFGAMKAPWSEQCKKVLHQTGESVTVRTFASALKPVWDATTRPELAFTALLRAVFTLSTQKGYYPLTSCAPAELTKPQLHNHQPQQQQHQHWPRHHQQPQHHHHHHQLQHNNRLHQTSKTCWTLQPRLGPKKLTACGLIFLKVALAVQMFKD